MGNLDDAIKSYQKALGIDPAHPQSFVINRLIGDILMKKGQKKQAIEYYEKAA